jgi:hypothetical protein
MVEGDFFEEAYQQHLYDSGACLRHRQRRDRDRIGSTGKLRHPMGQHANDFRMASI